jgi:phosphoribosylpyrophosphate synthetase
MASSLGNLLANMEHRINCCIEPQSFSTLNAEVPKISDVDDIEPHPHQVWYEECKKRETYHVIYHQSMKQFAERLHKHESADKKFELYNTYWDKFADGTDNITIGAIGRDENKNALSKINSPTYFKGKDLLFVASFYSNDVTMSQFHVLAHLCESFAKSLTVLLPFYSTATMERVDIDHDGVVPTASTLARLFNGLPSMGYPIRLMTYDLHTLQNRFYLTGHAVASLHTATKLMRNVIVGLKGTKNAIDCIAFPDAGAHKRFAKLFQEEIPETNTITCEKVRDGATRKITVIDGVNLLTDGTAKHILIVDDMINSGNTLIECERVLRDLCKEKLKVSIYTTHAVFNDTFFESVDSGKFNVFEKVYITDSIPNVVINQTVGGLPRTDINIPREPKYKNHPSSNKINIEIIELAAQIIKDL